MTLNNSSMWVLGTETRIPFPALSLKHRLFLLCQFPIKGHHLVAASTGVLTPATFHQPFFSNLRTHQEAHSMYHFSTHISHTIWSINNFWTAFEKDKTTMHYRIVPR